MKRLFLWGPVVAHMVLIFIASSIPDVKTMPGGMSDKTVHFWVYGLLGLFMVRALAGGSLSGVTPRRVWLSVLFAMLYGISDELHQAFVPGRSPDVRDVLADTLGAAGTVLIAFAISRWIRRRRQASAASVPAE